MSELIAVVRADRMGTGVGLKSCIQAVVKDGRGKTVLWHTLNRVAQVKGIKQVVVIFPESQEIQSLLDGDDFQGRLTLMPLPQEMMFDQLQSKRQVARKWAMTSWRGGLGGMSCYDELLPITPILHAVNQHKADGALLVGGDWMLVDPEFCDRVIARHLENPQNMAFVFSQCPPGLAGCVVGQELLSNMDQSRSTFGLMLDYNPSKVQSDPIAFDVCVPVEPVVRDTQNRFIYDGSHARLAIDQLAEKMGDELAHADRQTLVQQLQQLDSNHNVAQLLPGQLGLELTPRRGVSGKLLPQYYVDLDREDLSFELAQRIFQQIAAQGDVLLTLGGLGEPMLHDRFFDLIQDAKQQGVWGIHVETDLGIEEQRVTDLLSCGAEVISMRIHTDKHQSYDSWISPNDKKCFDLMIKNVEQLINGQRKNTQQMPWLVPTMFKIPETFDQIEQFFDRWTHFVQHAVIRYPARGCGLMPHLGGTQMHPPKRFSCRQLPKRMTILSNGQVVLCDQDWQGKVAAGHVKNKSLLEIWQSMHHIREQQINGQWQAMPLCKKCHEWHRP